MTNLVVKLSLLLVTNWPAIYEGTNQLGYVSTNHVVSVDYENRHHEIVVKTDQSNIAVWRPLISQFTNYVWPHTFCITNNLGPYTLEIR